MFMAASMSASAQLALDLARPCVAEGRAEGLARGVCRLFDEMGICSLIEVPLGCGRRADVLGQDGKGRFTIVEIKSGLADFRADSKWQDYRDHCDRLYFGVGSVFPLDVLPQTVGVIVADRFGAEIRREAPLEPMAQGLRRRQAIRFGRIAANRLRFFHEEPG